MKKLLMGAFFATLLAIALPASAATPNWDLTGTWTFNDIYLGVPYEHTMNITAFDQVTGAFSGTGFYNADPSLTWTVTGTQSGNDITVFNLLVTTVAPGVTISGSGTVNSSVSMSGIGYQSNLPGTDPNVTWTATGNALPIDNDSDSDGILNANDLCDSSTSDTTWLNSWGPNRWQVGNNLMWHQNKVVKGSTQDITSTKGIDYTYGCNGHDILQLLNDTFGNAMNGHWKYGISSGLLEEFHLDGQDGEIDGMYLLDTVIVNADDSDGVASSINLLNGVDYKLISSGTANAGDNIQFDADYSFRTGSSVTWTDSVNNYEGYGPTLLDLMVNNGFVDWDDDAVYNSDHTYTYNMIGSGSAVNLQVYDVYYPGNTGALTVKIFGSM